RHWAQELPTALLADATMLQRQREQLMHENRPATILFTDALYPLVAGQETDRDGLHHRRRVITQERHVGGAALTTAGAPHALQERRYRARGVGLKGQIQATHVDTEL